MKTAYSGARYLAPIVAGLTLAAAAGCTSSAASGGSASSSGGSTLGATQGVASSTITIGFSGPTGGPYALAGEQEESGVQAAINQVNTAGGIDGRKLSLVGLDDEFSPPREVTNFRQLATQDHVYAILGMPSLVPSTTYAEAKSTGVIDFPLVSFPDPHMKNVFLLQPTATGETSAIVDEIAKLETGKKNVRVAALFSQAQSFFIPVITSELAKYPNLHLVSTQTVPATTQNMTPYVLKAKTANPSVMIMLAFSTQDLLAMQVAGQQNFKPIFIGNGSTMAESPMLTLPEAAGAYRVAGFQASGSAYDAYAAASKSTGVAASDQGAENYAITEVFLHILKMCGKNLSWSHFEQVAQSVSGYDTGIFSPTTFGPLPDGHHASADTIVEQIVNHQWASVGGFTPEPASMANSN
jgi:branched-chain amino acid transport system substrate-binding protein